jgi:hypothetical protein
MRSLDETTSQALFGYVEGWGVKVKMKRNKVGEKELNTFLVNKIKVQN